MREMHECRVRVVHVEGAAGAGLLPLRTEHEVINNELAFAVEEIGERFLAARGFENVIRFDFDPGQLAPLRGHSVTLARELLLAGQQFFAGHEPFLSRNDFRVIDCAG